MTSFQERILELWSKGKMSQDENQMISLRLPTSLLSDLDECKDMLGVDRTALIRVILQEAVQEILELKEFMKVEEADKEGVKDNG